MDIHHLNVTAAVEYLELVLGVDWLKKNLKLAKEGLGGQGGFGREVNYGALGVAPVAAIWYRAREEMINLEIAGTGVPGPYTLQAAVMGDNLQALQSCPGIKERLESIKLHSDPTLLIQELHIARGYVRMGCRVSFKTGSGLACTGGGTRVLAYCAAVPVGPAGVICAQGPGAGQGVLSAISKQTVQQAGQQVLYLFTGEAMDTGDLLLRKGDTPPPEECPQQKKTVECIYDPGWPENLPVVVFCAGIGEKNNRPCYTVAGRMFNNTQNCNDAHIYIPGDLFSPV